MTRRRRRPTVPIDGGPWMIRPDGTYETVPLRSDSVAVGIVQTRAVGIDGDAPAAGLRANLDYVLGCIDKAQQFGGRCDLLCFHEFPLQGYRLNWSRKQYHNVAIEVPGPEVAEIAARAKRYNCYITFGCHGRDASWPGHVFNWQVMVGPHGDVVDVHWKQRNVRGMFPGAENITTTIYDVLDEYVERYGQDRDHPDRPHRHRQHRDVRGAVRAGAVPLHGDQGRRDHLPRRHRRLRVAGHAPDLLPQQRVHDPGQQQPQHGRRQPGLLRGERLEERLGRPLGDLRAARRRARRGRQVRDAAARGARR